MTALSLPSFMIALRIKFICSNMNYEQGYRTGNILHKNLRPRNNITIIKCNIVLPRSLYQIKLRFFMPLGGLTFCCILPMFSILLFFCSNHYTLSGIIFLISL